MQCSRPGQQYIATVIAITIVVIMIVFFSYARFRPLYLAAGVVVESSSLYWCGRPCRLEIRTRLVCHPHGRNEVTSDTQPEATVDCSVDSSALSLHASLRTHVAKGPSKSGGPNDSSEKQP